MAPPLARGFIELRGLREGFGGQGKNLDSLVGWGVEAYIFWITVLDPFRRRSSFLSILRSRLCASA